jgi:hypothetical protein
VNEFLRAKHFWRMIHGNDNMWSKVLNTKYIKNVLISNLLLTPFQNDQAYKAQLLKGLT